MKPKYIICENKTERDAVLGKLERQGYVWVGEGEKAIATCSPDDEFDFGTGAAIALARLMAKTPEALTDDVKTEWKKVLGIKEVEAYTDDDRNFKVGDMVVVRDWGDMAKEYGVKNNGISPNGCATRFTTIMKHLCGRTATITDAYDDYVRVEFDDKSGDTDWYFRRWMFNPSDSDKPTTKFKVGDLVTLREGVKEGDHFGYLDVEYGAMFDQSYHKPIKVIEISKAGSYLCVPAKGNGTDFYYHEEMLEKWNKDKIYEGDIVRVINTGLNYSTYPQWVGKHISDPDMAARYCFSSPSNGEDYKVIKIAEHESNGRTLAYIEQCEGFTYKKCYLIEVKGLEKVTE